MVGVSTINIEGDLLTPALLSSRRRADVGGQRSVIEVLYGSIEGGRGGRRRSAPCQVIAARSAELRASGRRTQQVSSGPPRHNRVRLT